MYLAKQGFIQIEAFFKMLDLHDIRLPAQDRVTLQKLCQTRAEQIKYKDALALIHFNMSYELNSTGVAVSNRPENSTWTLQVPKRRGKTKTKHVSLNADSQGNRAALNLDSASMVSNLSHVTEISIDPAVRLKAEYILDQTGARTFSNNQKTLGVINEELVQK